MLKSIMSQDPFKIIKEKESKKEVRLLWDYFSQISRIPRKSGQEQKIAAHFVSWATQNNFYSEVDTAGNVLILTSPDSNNPGVILQGHLDMVCVGTPDPSQNGVTPQLSTDLEWLSATNTTLGADNGIGLATMMSLANNLKDIPLALMLTTAEEIGIGGAMNLNFQKSLSNFKHLLNLDSEELGTATISSAGGGDTIISLPLIKEKIDPQQGQFVLTIEGLPGGHSGIEINQNRLNAIKVAADILRQLTKIESFRLIDINLGIARNAIPSSGQITLTCSNPSLAKKTLSSIKYPQEPKFKIKLSSLSKKVSSVIAPEVTNKLINLLIDLPHGVISMSSEVNGLVQTSTNLAKVSTSTTEITVEMMTRSSVNSELDSTRNQISTAALPHGAKVDHHPSYPGWPAKPQSLIIKHAQDSWKKVSGQKLHIMAIHAGLECGVILNKYPHLEAISIGPTIQGAHSTTEKVHIPSVKTFYDFTEDLVKKLTQN